MAPSVERIGEQIAAVLESLGPIAGDAKAAAELVKILGWDLPPGVADIGLTGIDVATVSAKIEHLTELRGREASATEVAAAVAEVLAAVGETLDHLVDLAENLQGTSAYLQATRIREQFFDRLADLIVIQMVGQAASAVVPLGMLLGLFEFTEMPADPAIFQVAHVRQKVHWNRFALLFDDPASVPRDVYGWGTANFDGNLLLANLARVVDWFADDVTLRQLPREFEEAYAGHPVPATADPLAKLTASVAKGLGVVSHDVGAMLFPVRPTTAGGADGGLALMPYAFGTVDQTFEIGDNVELVLTAGTANDLAGGLVLELRPNQDPEVRTGLFGADDDPTAGFGLAVRTGAPAGERKELFSASVLTIDAKSLQAGIQVTVSGSSVEPAVTARIEDARVRIVPRDADSFVASVLPESGLTMNLDLEASWSRSGGLRIRGGAALRTTLALHLSAGPFTLDTLDISLQAGTEDVRLTTLLTGRVELGPITATVDKVGAALTLRFERGNLGPVDLGAGFVPPSGIGLEIDAGVVSGGGFIAHDADTGRYAGLLKLTAGEFGLTGVGLLDTRVPGGDYALLIALRATFPGIQVGFGFALTAVGGLLALNRRVDVDALRSRLAGGTAGRILAPDDPSRVIADLDAVFPVAAGRTVVGPTARLVWARLVTFDIGIFIELPGPSRIVLLGSARAAIESGSRCYLQLRVDIAGAVDLNQQTAAFDAVLIDSHLLEIFDLTGGAAFRLSWGNRPHAVLTLGGFHPAYDPGPLNLPASLTRIAMVHGQPKSRLYLRLEGYFAVTSNTLQLGAQAEAIINAGSFNIRGMIGFDALIQFQPFHFRFDIRAQVHVRYKSRKLAGLTLTGSLSGPGPMVLKAKVCIEILWFDICFSDTFTLGSSVRPPVTTVASALDVLVAELNRPQTLHLTEGTDRYVTLRPATDPNQTVLSPVGRLSWAQQAAPLGLLLQRIGGARLGEQLLVEATSGHATGVETDWFAPGSFADLTDEEALTRPGFERLTSGLRFGQPGSTDGPGMQKSYNVRQVRLPARQVVDRLPHDFPRWLVDRDRRIPVQPRITAGDEEWITVHPGSGGRDPEETLAGAQARQRGRTSGRIAVPIADQLPAFSF